MKTDTLKTGHTPGPWKITIDEQYPCNGNHYIWAKYGDLDIPLASLPHGGNYPTEMKQEANARLIAVAPDLLEALEELLESLEITQAELYVPDQVNRCIEAIAKAKGKSD